MEILKKCSKCKETKAISAFSNYKRAKDGLRSYCKECASKYFKVWLENNKEHNIKRVAEFIKNNPDKNNAKAAKYRASKLKATPKWLTKSQLAEIANIYKQAKELEKETGLKHHVNHIIPLKGKNVCGLHTPWNLQILKAEENIRKSNKM